MFVANHMHQIRYHQKIVGLTSAKKPTFCSRNVERLTRLTPKQRTSHKSLLPSWKWYACMRRSDRHNLLVVVLLTLPLAQVDNWQVSTSWIPFSRWHFSVVWFWENNINKSKKNKRWHWIREKNSTMNVECAYDVFLIIVT